MTICPCCGFKSEHALSGALNSECRACGARAVGEPLPRPEHELPSYGRALVLSVTGALMVLIFLTQTIIALAQRSTRGATSNLAMLSMIPFDPGSWIAAAETAAWRLKWLAIPVTILVLWGCRKLYLSIAQSPSRFCGVRYARRGYLASALVPLMILILIGVTVPERLRQRQRGIEAGFNAQGYRIDRALDQYRKEFDTLPSDLKDLGRLPDPDGSIAAALKNLDASGYTVNAEVAAVPKKKPQQLRGAVIRNASFGAADDIPTERISFTNYDLRLPGADKLLGTEDDLIMRDGVITKASETARRWNNNTIGTQGR